LDLCICVVVAVRPLVKFFLKDDIGFQSPERFWAKFGARTGRWDRWHSIMLS
jgi:hypothetical protein